jgi:hypothetical protein
MKITRRVAVVLTAIAALMVFAAIPAFATDPDVPAIVSSAAADIGTATINAGSASLPHVAVVFGFLAAIALVFRLIRKVVGR